MIREQAEGELVDESLETVKQGQKAVKRDTTERNIVMKIEGTKSSATESNSTPRLG